MSIGSSPFPRASREESPFRSALALFYAALEGLGLLLLQGVERFGAPDKDTWPGLKPDSVAPGTAARSLLPHRRRGTRACKANAEQSRRP